MTQETKNTITSAIKYSIIPTPCQEKDLRTSFPWIGKRQIMIPSGWLGLVHMACKEIEVVLAPENAKDVVEYFFATMRESRLRIFIQFTDQLYGEVRSLAIKSLLTEVSNHSYITCHICGKEVKEQGHFGSQRGVLPDCGEHNDDNINDESVNSEPMEDSSSIVDIVVNSDEKEDLDVLIAEPAQVTIEDSAQTISRLANIQLYDITALQKLLLDVSTKYRDREDVTKIKTILNKLIKVGGDRTLKPLPNQGVAFLDELQTNFPNFCQVIDMLRGINALSSDGEVARIPAMLLLGPPGVGKTMFAEALASGMQVSFKVVRMENQQAGAGLVGSADFWSNSKSGAVFEVLTNGECGNPVIVVDEVDKAATDSRYNPINGLYSLLEPGSASAFHDESLPDISINASKITWILTANYEQFIPEPILSRVLIFEIPSPDQNQSAQVAERIYQLLLGESNTLKTRFASTLTDEVAQLLATMTPRKMRLAIEIALGRAAVAKRTKLIANDINVVKKPLKMKIGFL